MNDDQADPTTVPDMIRSLHAMIADAKAASFWARYEDNVAAGIMEP